MQFYRIRRTNQNNWTPGVLHHEFGQANPIKHARLTLDCDCNFDLNDIMPKTLKTDCESGICSKEFTGEYKALRKVRNSNGQASRVSLSNREYLKAKCATYDQNMCQISTTYVRNMHNICATYEQKMCEI